jgi:hypothetical protein
MSIYIIRTDISMGDVGNVTRLDPRACYRCRQRKRAFSENPIGYQHCCREKDLRDVKREEKSFLFFICIACNESKCMSLIFIQRERLGH